MGEGGNRKIGMEGERDGRITRSGVVYSRLSKAKATANLAHTNQSTLRCRGEGALARGIQSISVKSPSTNHGRPPRPRPRRWRAGHREKTDRRRATARRCRGANADITCSFPLLRFAARLFSRKQWRRNNQVFSNDVFPFDRQ